MADYEQVRKLKQRTSVQQQEQQPELSVSPLAEVHAAVRRATSDPNRLTTRDVMTLQRSVGNRAVAHVLGRNRSVQRVAQGGFETGSDFESRLQRSKGGGAPLPDNLRAEFEPKFGADFGRVRTHTDGQSDQLNRSIQAKAFTTGNDIFFRKGEYNTGVSRGKELLAHELTHTVQQGAAPIQRQAARSIEDEANQRQGRSRGDGSAASAVQKEHRTSRSGQEVVSHGLTHGGQPMHGLVQRDEIMPVEDYGDLSIPKSWQLKKKFLSKRKELPSNKMKPTEDRDEVSDRLNVKKSEARERARMKNKPAPDELTQKTDDLGELYAHAQMLKDFYDHSLEKYARQTGGEYHAGPIKTLGRTMDKVTTDYSDKDTSQQRPERVKDLLRSSIVYMDARDLARGVRNMKLLEPAIKVRNVKNKFKKGQGYGDINMSLEIGDGFITELQMHLASFWALKHTKQDHDRYEDISILERAKEKKKGQFGQKKQAKLDQMKEQHSRSYDEAMESEGDPEGAREVLKAIQEYST